MAFAILGLLLLLLFLLIAVRVGTSRGKARETEEEQPVIHKSGIYSIVRRSPREILANYKPSEDALRKYLAGKNEDIEGRALSSDDKEALVEAWRSRLEASIAAIEEGDKKGIEFYRYAFSGPDPVCERALPQRPFVSREQIFKYPNIIPPFHLGCLCELQGYHGDEKLRETSVHQTKSLFDENTLPKLPDWKQILAPGKKD